MFVRMADVCDKEQDRKTELGNEQKVVERSLQCLIRNFVLVCYLCEGNYVIRYGQEDLLGMLIQ